jgi:hypothetical protein
MKNTLKNNHNYTFKYTFKKIAYQLSIIYSPPPRYHNFLSSQKYYIPSYVKFVYDFDYTVHHVNK